MMLDSLFQSYKSSSRIQSDGAFILERSKRSLVPCLFHSEKLEETTNNLDPCQFFLCAMLGTERNGTEQHPSNEQMVPVPAAVSRLPCVPSDACR
mmetsp:Transcript_20059/g.46919  ORF Transcript_20059/g.46919 Transcript_20059/m.46919 type:complete len:95 (+) Transcript_20059:430-714(+)